MKTTKIPTIYFFYEDHPDNKRQVQVMYNRVLEIARKNILSGNLVKLTNKVTVSAKAFIINDKH